ncbi:MAG: DUF4856 domain-containing protein [Deltaproteobacteria bacterium]|nr:DUF4856 domain-containing protein [Deltaproteobacteria bacterium]
MRKLAWLLIAACALCACGDDGGLTVPDSYQFDSRYDDSQSSVGYTGQTLRHVLIADLNRQIDGLTARVDDAVTNGPLLAAGDVTGSLLFYYEFDSSVGGDVAIQMTADTPFMQTTYSEISTGKNLVGKIAGNDSVTDHRDWSTDFVGFDAATPDALVRAWFAELETAALNRQGGTIPTDPNGNQIQSVYVTADGRDLEQLTQKFLLGAVALSQGLDDYLDDDVEGKGLLAANTRDDDAPYTVLEHQWDEGFGYFGASRFFLDMSDDEIADGLATDGNGDNLIDLRAEYNFGVSVNAAKRDRGSDESARTDFTREGFEAFLRGRALIANMDETPSARDIDELREQRDIIARVWLSSIAATAIHYVNDTLADMDDFGTADYSFADHAKHWSELKGFLLGLQFAPQSPLPRDKFVELDLLVGTAPVLSSASAQDIADYRAALLQVRDDLTTAFEFESINAENW